MSDTSVTVIGAHRVANRLRRLAADSPKVADKVLYKWGQETRRVLKSTPYPPRRPAQKYVRTGRLANSWKVIRGKPGQVSIVNEARSPRGQVYPSYVVGDAKGKGQAWMHKSRWWVARPAIDKEARRLPPALTKELMTLK